MAKKDIQGLAIPYGIKSPNKMANADGYYGTYDSLQDALDTVVLAIREPGRTVGIKENDKVVEYWWESTTDLSDAALVKKTSDGGEVTRLEGTTLIKSKEALTNLPPESYELFKDSNGIYLGKDVGADIIHDVAQTSSFSSGNVAIGNKAMYQAYDRSLQGIVAIGDWAYSGATRGNGNVAVGLNSAFGLGAVPEDTTATGYSVFMGYNSGREAGTVYGSIALGQNASRNARFVNYSIMIGASAGQDSKYSSNEVLIGTNVGKGLVKGTGYGNTIGIGNSAYGGRAPGAKTQYSSIFIGREAGSACSDGAHNIGIGDSALRSILGRGNVGIGSDNTGDTPHGAGRSISGDHNIILGARSGQTTTGSDNFVVGHFRAETLNGSNNVNILGSRHGSHSNTTVVNAVGLNSAYTPGNYAINFASTITGTSNPSDRRVAINAPIINSGKEFSAPRETLEVHGNVLAKKFKMDSGEFMSTLELEGTLTEDVILKLPNRSGTVALVGDNGSGGPFNPNGANTVTNAFSLNSPTWSIKSDYAGDDLDALTFNVGAGTKLTFYKNTGIRFEDSEQGNSFSIDPFGVGVQEGENGWYIGLDSMITHRGEYYYPTQSGTMVMSINGVKADATGNISIDYTPEEIGNFNKTSPGLVPAPGGTTSTKFLREDGTWVIPTNTTYTAGTLAILNTGTSATAQTWSAKILNDHLKSAYIPRSGNTAEAHFTGNYFFESGSGIVFGDLPTSTTSPVGSIIGSSPNNENFIIGYYDNRDPDDNCLDTIIFSKDSLRIDKSLIEEGVAKVMRLSMSYKGIGLTVANEPFMAQEEDDIVVKKYFDTYSKISTEFLTTENPDSFYTDQEEYEYTAPFVSYTFTGINSWSSEEESCLLKMPIGSIEETIPVEINNSTASEDGKVRVDSVALSNGTRGYIKFWTGTREALNALPERHTDTLYIVEAE